MQPESYRKSVSRKRPRRTDGGAWDDFRDYACRNPSCVLSRFDKFSMALTDDPRCPVCGERVFDGGDSEVLTKPS